MSGRTRAEGTLILRTSRLILLLLLVTFALAVSLVWPIASRAKDICSMIFWQRIIIRTESSTQGASKGERSRNG